MSTCRWCTPGGSEATELLKKYSSRSLSPEEENALNEDLCYCLECVVEYHRARDELPSFHKLLWNLETSRLLDRFTQSCDAELEEDDLFIVEDDQEIYVPKFTGPEYENFLRVPLLEILKYPYLLEHREISEMCVETLCKMEKVNSFQVFDKYPGIYLLLVHPNETVRKWAICTARSLGKVDRDDFYDLQEVFSCMCRAIELDLILNSDLFSSYVRKEGKMVLLPPHLYDCSNYKNYWLGICMLLTVLDAQAMDSLLLGPDKQNDLMQSILNAMEKEEEDEKLDPFWPALQCFMVILDRLGSKVWGKLIDPARAFQRITRSRSYQKELENLRQTTNGTKVELEDAMTTCSQIIYDCNKEKSKDSGTKTAVNAENCAHLYEEMHSLMNVLQSDMGKEMRVHNSTFLWLISFVQSVVDLKELSIVCIGEIVHFLCGEINNFINGQIQKCDKVTEFFILVLVFVIELHLNKSSMNILNYSSSIWVDVIVNCAVLSVSAFSASSDSCTARKSSTSSLRTLSWHPQVSNVVPQACVQIIRSLLKEGCKLSVERPSKYFLDLLNKHLRETAYREWRLSSSQLKNLQLCLRQLVANLNGKEESPGSGTNSGDDMKYPIASIKQERVEEWDGCENQDNGMTSTSNTCERNTGLGVLHQNYPLKQEVPWDGEDCGQLASGIHPNVGDRSFKTDLQDQYQLPLKKERTSPVHMCSDSNKSKISYSFKSEMPDSVRSDDLKSEQNNGPLCKISEVISCPSSANDQKDDVSFVSKKNEGGQKLSNEECASGSKRPLECISKYEASSGGPHISNVKYGKSESSDDDDDDVPLTVIMSNLHKTTSLYKTLKNSMQLTDPQTDRDVNLQSSTASSESTSFPSNSNKEYSVSRDRIERRVKCNARSGQALENQDVVILEPDTDSGAVIVISDSESAKDDNETPHANSKETCRNFKAQEMTIKCEHSKSIDLMNDVSKSANNGGTDCGFNEYDSQLFEFETEEKVFSAWEDPEISTVVGDTENKDASNELPFLHSSEDLNDLCNDWGYETDFIPDDYIHKASEYAEELIKKQQISEDCIEKDPEKEPTTSSFNNDTKEPPCRIAGENDDQSPISLLKKTLSKKLAEKRASSGASISNVTKDLGTYSKKGTNGRSLKKPKETSSSSKNNFKKATTTLPLKVTGLPKVHSPSSLKPAIITPKKVRQQPEPNSTAEKLGLKKRERKAFDLSQRSLDCVAQLRNYGQRFRIENETRKYRTTKSSLPSRQKQIPKNKRKMLASQDLQYFRLSRGKATNINRDGTSDPILGKRAKICSSSITQKKSSGLIDSLKAKENKQLAKEEKDVISPKASAAKTGCSDGDAGGNKLFFLSSLPIPQVAESDQLERNCDLTSKEIPEVSSTTCSANELGVFAQLNTDLPQEVAGQPRKHEFKCDRVVDDDDDDDDDNMYLTQMDPVDMELCPELDNADNFALTQRDPVDMEIDESESQVCKDDSGKVDSIREGQVAHSSWADTYASGSVEKSVTSEQKDDHVFLKPGIPSPYLKQAKPSTTKIYAQSSRNANLAQEMEKTSKPLPAALKIRAVRPPPPLRRSSMPPPESRSPLQPKTPVTPSSNPPESRIVAYKPRVPVCTPHERTDSSTTKKPPHSASSFRFNQNDMIQQMLKWNYEMFCNYAQFGTPDDLCSFPLREVPTNFTSFEDYFTTFYPLLMVNAFEELVNNWRQSKSTIRNSLRPVAVEYPNGVSNATFTASLTRSEVDRQLYPKEEHLVCLWLHQHTNTYANEDSEMLEPIPSIGYVLRANISHGGDTPTLTLTIQTRVSFSLQKLPVMCEVIGSLISTIRGFKGLSMLRNSLMARPLLSPNAAYFSFGEQKNVCHMPEFNTDQVKAINCALTMIKEQRRTPKICLIQGPPGTGKTRTIVGLLQRIFTEDRENLMPQGNRIFKGRKPRVLVCAPSNAAVDHLMRNIIVDFKGKCRNRQTPLGNCGDINLVRLGMEKAISDKLLGFSLDHQIKVKTKKGQEHDTGIHRRKEQLDQELERVSNLLSSVNKKDILKLQRLTDEKFKLLEERKQLGRMLRETKVKKQEIQTKIVLDAHVICCTLNTSGSILLESAFRRLGHDPFCCVIVDEAGQATETETLIPLMHRCPCLVLVGDPEQLPPTVVSQKAKEKGYDQSLMARLWKSLHRELRAKPHVPNPIIFLATQYRMHPDICEFPSRYIYDRALKTDGETAEKRCGISWPFQPYILFDVTDGFETRNEDSFSNLQEVKLVIRLIKLIFEKQVTRVGVITPYSAQKQKIKEYINKEQKLDTNKHFQSVEVDTIDGFQGCEKDCIIVSCVRACSTQGSIGFMGNRQRLNVTITRAKFSLFILGHLRTLTEHKDWEALIQDAGKRGTIIKTREKDYNADARKIFKPEPGFLRSFSFPPKDSSLLPKTSTPTDNRRMSADKSSMVKNSALPAARTTATVSRSQTSDSSTAGFHAPEKPAAPAQLPGKPSTSGRPRDPRLASRSAHIQQPRSTLAKSSVPSHPQSRVYGTYGQSSAPSDCRTSAAGRSSTSCSAQNSSASRPSWCKDRDEDKDYRTPCPSRYDRPPPKRSSDPRWSSSLEKHRKS
nr:PREDICTED: probable helicase senataxin isoform X2 [Lepisosteus oculatus]